MVMSVLIWTQHIHRSSQDQHWEFGKNKACTTGLPESSRLTGWRRWLAHHLKMEGDHLNIKIVDSSVCCNPNTFLICGNVRFDTNKLKKNYKKLFLPKNSLDFQKSSWFCKVLSNSKIATVNIVFLKCWQLKALYNLNF